MKKGKKQSSCVGCTNSNNGPSKFPRVMKMVREGGNLGHN